MRTLDLHTVCESARCPNMGECWEHGTATFMILGDICTRACGFCAVPSGKPVGPPDEEEPFRVAEAVARMGLRYAVVTSVNRDDQADGGRREQRRRTDQHSGEIAGDRGESRPLMDAVDYAERITSPGFVFMITPGYDPVSLAGLAAGGCNLIAFTTGAAAPSDFLLSR